MTTLAFAFRGSRTREILADAGLSDAIIVAAVGDRLAQPNDMTPDQALAHVQRAIDDADDSAPPGHFGSSVDVRIVCNGGTTSPLVELVVGLERLRFNTAAHEGGEVCSYMRLALEYVDVQRDGLTVIRSDTGGRR